MIKKFLLLSLLTVAGFANPYENISVDEKLTLFTNHFLNETIKSKFPEIPPKGVVNKDKYNYQPTKYERNYNYVQRIKAINESIAREQEEIDNKFAADIYKYNKKLQALKKFYSEDKNLYPILTNSLNKALKVVYGKPVLTIKSENDGAQFFLDIETIYSENNFSPIPLEFNLADEKRMFSFYEKCDVSVKFTLKENFLIYDEVVCNYNNKIYQGKFNEKNNEKIKLNVKINDDIFQKIEMKTNNGINK